MVPNTREHRRHLSGSFYVEHVCENGEVVLQYVEPERLTEKGGCLYLYGWCEAMPAFRCIPVHRMTQLVDDRTGEMVPRGDIAGWLTNRTLN